MATNHRSHDLSVNAPFCAYHSFYVLTHVLMLPEDMATKRSVVCSRAQGLPERVEGAMTGRMAMWFLDGRDDILNMCMFVYFLFVCMHTVCTGVYVNIFVRLHLYVLGVRSTERNPQQGHTLHLRTQVAILKSDMEFQQLQQTSTILIVVSIGN